MKHWILALLACAFVAPSLPADDAPQFPRGARRSPAHKILAAPAHQVLQAPPAQYAVVPKQLDMWGNDQYGDCVTAEEAFAKACYSPEIFIPSSEAVSWAQTHGYLNGADLVTVMTSMQSDGFPGAGQLYDDGAYSTVDYSNETVLRSAVATAGPVKIAIDANALPAGAGHQSGWYAIGGGSFPNTDHCVSICGYGPAEYLYSQLNTPLPAALPGNTTGYLVYTWSTIGFVDHAWLMGTTTEAFARSPTTVIVPDPAPPTPTPSPRRFSFAEIIKLLIAIRHPHLSPAESAAVADFLARDDDPRVSLLKTIVYARGVEAGLIPVGAEIGAVNWQQLIKIIVELEPLIVPLIPLLLGDEPQTLLAPRLTLCAAGAPAGYRTECGPHGCRLVPAEKTDTLATASAAAASPRPAGLSTSTRRARRRYFQGGYGGGRGTGFAPFRRAK